MLEYKLYKGRHYAYFSYCYNISSSGSAWHVVDDKLIFIEWFNFNGYTIIHVYHCKPNYTKKHIGHSMINLLVLYSSPHKLDKQYLLLVLYIYFSFFTSLRQSYEKLYTFILLILLFFFLLFFFISPSLSCFST